ncbi:unnamed protein product, partial [Fusarium graminearum]
MPRVNIGPFHLNRDDTTKLANKPFRRNIDAFLEAQALDTNLEKALKAEIEAISGTCCQGCLVGNRKLNSNIRICAALVIMNQSLVLVNFACTVCSAICVEIAYRASRRLHAII